MKTCQTDSNEDQQDVRPRVSAVIKTGKFRARFGLGGYAVPGPDGLGRMCGIIAGRIELGFLHENCFQFNPCFHEMATIPVFLP